MLKDVNIDLRKSKVIIGQVIKTGFTYIDVRISWIVHKKIFYFMLQNPNEKFDSAPPEELYKDLESNIKIEDTLKAYYQAALWEYSQGFQ